MTALVPTTATGNTSSERAKNLVVSFFEWFGELGIFCARLGRVTEARAMVVRDYLVKNFKMDDTRVKTIGLGKSQDADGAGVAVLVYPVQARK